MLQRLFALVSMVVALAGCATVSATPAELAELTSGERSGIIMSYRTYEGLYSASVTFVNLETHRPYTLRMHGGENWVGAGPDLAVVDK